METLFRSLTPITRKVVAAGDVPAATPMGLSRDDLDDDSAHLGLTHCASHVPVRLVLKSIALFVLAALLEIGGAWLVWQGVREHRGLAWIGAGVIALGAYGFVAAFQPDPHFGRVLAAYGGVFIAGSLLWGMVADGFRPDRWDVTGAVIALVGVGSSCTRRAEWPTASRDARSRRRARHTASRSRELGDQGWLRFHSTQPTPVRPSAVVTVAHARGK